MSVYYVARRYYEALVVEQLPVADGAHYCGAAATGALRSVFRHSMIFDVVAVDN